MEVRLLCTALFLDMSEYNRLRFDRDDSWTTNPLKGSVKRCSQNRRSVDVVEELKKRGFFQQLGEKETGPIPYIQSVDDFITGLHSRSSFSSERMGQQKVLEFDNEVNSLLSPFQIDGMLSLQVVATVTWGRPEVGLI